MIRNTRQFAVLAAAALDLVACATAEGYRQRTALWLGASSDMLLVERGAPVQRDRLSDGRDLWVYFVRQHHHTDGYTSQVPHQRTVRRTAEDGSVTEFRETYYQTVYNPPSDWWSECETRFVIGLTGLVEDFRFEGDGCLAAEIE